MNQQMLLDMMAWARGECSRRGCTDSNTVMRMIHESRRKLVAGNDEKRVMDEIAEELRIAGYFESDAEREEYERRHRAKYDHEAGLRVQLNASRRGEPAPRILGANGNPVAPAEENL